MLLDAPIAGGSPGMVCTTAGDFAGTPPVFKALPAEVQVETPVKVKNPFG